MAINRTNGKGGMTVSEAGRKGGERVRDERGVGFYQEIGRKGGELGGRKGGEAVRDKYGPAFYEEIGKKGGESVRASRGPEFYSMIGHKGGQKVRELIEQGKRLGQKAQPARTTLPEESSSNDRAPSGGAGMNTGKNE